MINAMKQATSVVCRKKSSILKYAVQIIGVILLFAGLCHAGWERTYGGSRDDFGYSVATTLDGGYIITGYTESFGGGEAEIYILKLDALGDTIWTRTYGGRYDDYGLSVSPTSDSGCIVAGMKDYGGDWLMGDVYVLKLDASGDTMWTRIYRYKGQGRSVLPTPGSAYGGGYVVAGWITWSYPPLYHKVYILKLDAFGDTIWTRTYGGSGDDYGLSVTTTLDSAYYVVGYTSSFGAGLYDVYVLKLNTSGNIIWTRTYGGSGNDFGYSVSPTLDGGCIVVGYTESFGTGLYDVFVLRLDALGDTKWTRTYGGSGSDEAYSICHTMHGGYIIAGHTRSFGAGWGDAYVLKLDGFGDTLWTKTYGGTFLDYGYSISLTWGGGYIIAGRTESFGASASDIYVIKTDSNGYVDWVKEIPQKPQSISITVSPNPFNSSCAITTLTGAQVKIYDLRGRLIWNKPSDSDYIGATSLIKGGKPEEVPLNKGDVAKRQGVYIWRPDESISSGVYLVRATTDVGNQITKHIVYLK